MDQTDINLFGKTKKRDKKDSISDNDDDESKSKIDDSGHDEKDGHQMNKFFYEPKISIPAENHLYRNDHVHTGLAIIFNHEIIKGESPRIGTEKDKNDLTRSLRSLGFTVKKYNDLSFQEITRTLDEAAQDDFTDYDCFCITVLSHGETGKVFARDMLYPVERLWKPFLGYKCPSLINKPKIFFIQACRGTNIDPGVQYRGFMSMSRGVDIPDATPQKLVTFAIPSTADLLIMYSTFEGSYSWRNPLNGSWFVQALCTEINKFIESRDNEIDLFHLLTSVCRNVAYEYQSNVPGNEGMDEMKEMPQIVSTLTKIFNLRIKN